MTKKQNRPARILVALGAACFLGYVLTALRGVSPAAVRAGEYYSTPGSFYCSPAWRYAGGIKRRPRAMRVERRERAMGSCGRPGSEQHLRLGIALAKISRATSMTVKNSSVKR